jgi:hypothetical protein
MPTAAVHWRDACYGLTVATWSVWTITIAITLMATIGFASVEEAPAVGASAPIFAPFPPGLPLRWVVAEYKCVGCPDPRRIGVRGSGLP